MSALLLVSLALAAPVPKAAAPELKWKFAKGDSYYLQYEQETSNEVNLGGGGAPQKITSTTAWVFKVGVVSTGERETVLELESVSHKQEVNAGGGAIAAPPPAGQSKDVSGKVVRFTLDAKQKVTKVEGGEELVKAIGGGASMMGSEEGLKYLLEHLLHAVPGKTLAKGDKWNSETENSLMNGLTAKRVSRGTVDSLADGVAKLTVESDHEWTGAPEVGNGGPAAAVSYNLKGEKGQTVIVFDTTKGQLKKLEESVPLTGSVSIGGPGVAGGQKIDVSVTMKTTVTVSDEKP